MAAPAASPSVETPKPPPPARWLWIISNESGARIVPLRGSVSSVSKTLVPGPQFNLMPGANIVEAALWKRFKEEHADQVVDGVAVKGDASHLLTDKIPQADHRARQHEGAGQPFLVEGPAITDMNTPLASLTEQEARGLVANLRDEPMLRRLLQTERRSVVAEALRERVEQFEQANRQTY